MIDLCLPICYRHEWRNQILGNKKALLKYEECLIGVIMQLDNTDYKIILDIF